MLPGAATGVREMHIPESISGVPGCVNIGCCATVLMPSNPKDAARSLLSKKATICVFGATDGCVYVVGGCAGGKVGSAKVIEVPPIESPTAALEKKAAEANLAGGELASSLPPNNIDGILECVDATERKRGSWIMQSLVAFRLTREDVAVVVGYVPSPSAGELLLQEYHHSKSSKDVTSGAPPEYASLLVFYTVKPFDALAVAPEERALRITNPSGLTNEHLSTRRTVQVKQHLLTHCHLTRLLCIHAESGPFRQANTDATEPPPHLCLMYSGLDVRTEAHDFKCLSWPVKSSKRRGKKAEGKVLPPVYEPSEKNILRGLVALGGAEAPICSMHYMCFTVDRCCHVERDHPPLKLRELLVAGCVDGRVLLVSNDPPYDARLLVQCSGPVSDVKFFFPTTRRERHSDTVEFLDDILERDRRRSVKATLVKHHSTLSSGEGSFTMVSALGSDDSDDDSTDLDADATLRSVSPLADQAPSLPCHPPAFGSMDADNTLRTVVQQDPNSGSMSSESRSKLMVAPAAEEHHLLDHAGETTIQDLIIAVADSAGAVFTFERFLGPIDAVLSTTVLDVEECPGGGEEADSPAAGHGAAHTATPEMPGSGKGLADGAVGVTSTATVAPTSSKSVASRWLSSNKGKATVAKERDLAGSGVQFGASVESLGQDELDDSINTPHRLSLGGNATGHRLGSLGASDSQLLGGTVNTIDDDRGERNPKVHVGDEQRRINHAFSATWTGTVIARGPTSITVCDIDGDGANELIVTTFGRTIAYCKRRLLTHAPVEVETAEGVVRFAGSTSSFHRDLGIRSSTGSFVTFSEPNLHSPASDDGGGLRYVAPAAQLQPSYQQQDHRNCAIVLPSQYAVSFVAEVYCQMYGAFTVDFHSSGQHALVFSGPEQIAVQTLVMASDMVEAVLQRLAVVQKLLGMIPDTALQSSLVACEPPLELSSPSFQTVDLET